MPHARSSSLAAVLVLAVALSACAGSAAGIMQDDQATAAVPQVASDTDPGALARQEVLDRYANGAPPVTLVTPDIIGRSPGSAERVLAETGLEIRLVAFDRRRPVTVQHPAAGQPVPLDGVVEAWLGEPPPEEVDPASRPAGTPTPTPTRAPTPTPQPDQAEEAPLAAAAPSGTRYVLPPHTDGLLRTNPRQLPAVPAGTELTGQASWYGPGFHGLTTACGGVYDQNAATLATRELRCGTVVRITGPSGLTVEATVTDWGPAEWTGRRFDLSAAVFNAIAPLGAGVIPVRLVTTNVPR